MTAGISVSSFEAMAKDYSREQLDAFYESEKFEEHFSMVGETIELNEDL